METRLNSGNTEVTISPGSPFVIIGEKINPTGRKKLSAAIRDGNYEYILNLAKIQIDAGAHILNVNVGVPEIDEVHVLPEVALLISESFNTPLCIDSANPNALAATMAVLPGKPLINSVNGEEKSLEKTLPLLKEHNATVIGLTMDDRGIPGDVESRLAIAEKIVERAAQKGISENDIIIDPLVLTGGADSKATWVTLGTIEMMRKEFGVNINFGESNVSFGLPDRHTVNQAFLSVAMGFGATYAITDPVKLAGTIRATDLLLGRDNHGIQYIKYSRAHQQE